MSDNNAADYFSLFALPRAPLLDEEELAERYRQLQSLVHPDRYAGAAELQRQLSLQQASRINDAYAVLKKPLARAAYLLSLYGADVYGETDTAMAADFLEQQLEWREALLEADEKQRAQLIADITAARDAVAAESARQLSALVAGGGDTAAPYDTLRRWVTIEKLLLAAEDAEGAAAGGQ